VLRDPAAAPSGSWLSRILARAGDLRRRSGGGHAPLLGLAVLYLLAVSAIMIWRRIVITPDYLFLIMVPLALLAGRLTRFLREWVPFVALLLGWEAMRGLAPTLGASVHTGGLDAEKILFLGQVPTVILQKWVAAIHLRAFMDPATTIIYFGHFAVTLGVAMLLWLGDRPRFLQYSTALLGMSFAAFLIFVVVPTAPPWWAADHGLFQGMHRIFAVTLPSRLSPYYRSLNPNPVAAIPSLHAAFPFLTYLVLRRRYRLAAGVALAWCLLVWWSVVYLGEHYVVDVLAGAALALIAWIVVQRLVVPRVSGMQVRPRLRILQERRAEAMAGRAQ
jgi:membrane-associated phospholipid phosphatase